MGRRRAAAAEETVVCTVTPRAGTGSSPELSPVCALFLPCSAPLVPFRWRRPGFRRTGAAPQQTRLLRAPGFGGCCDGPVIHRTFCTRSGHTPASTPELTPASRRPGGRPALQAQVPNPSVNKPSRVPFAFPLRGRHHHQAFRHTAGLNGPGGTATPGPGNRPTSSGGLCASEGNAPCPRTPWPPRRNRDQSGGHTSPPRTAGHR